MKNTLDMQSNIITKTFPTAADVAEAALHLILQSAAEAIEKRGKFVLSLAGGSTPKLLYQLLATSHQNWDNWYLVYGDERCLPYGDHKRNSTLVEEYWLRKIGFPLSNHLTADITNSTEEDARQYQKKISSILPIDFALLGMGEDGHTASLFPASKDRTDSTTDCVIAVHNAPKPPSNRISLSYQTFNQARVVCFLVTGSSKQQAIQQWLAGDDLPVSQIAGTADTYLFLDNAAEISRP